MNINQELIERFFQDKCSSEEVERVIAYLNEHPSVLEKYMGEEDWMDYLNAMRLHPSQTQRMLSFIRLSTYSKTKRSGWIRYAAAAVLFVFISSAIYFLTNTNRKSNSDIAKNNQPLAQINDRLPGGDKAILTLANGSQIVLDSAGNGILALQGSTKILKNQDGQVVYNTSGEAIDRITFNTLTTPRGGQYRITLPDGSKVWLNAASSLKYPVAFIGKDRRVEVTGEAYFEIAKDASRPFKVQLNQMEVEVLGTHFNINGYDDEDLIRTTLFEGSVKINTTNGNSFLRPGQQAQLLKTGRLKLIDNADLEETIAWKDGNFQFDNSDINTVMRQLTRWYDIDIAYKGTVTKHFLGTISRNVSLSKVLTMLQQTGEVKFIIDGKKVIVMP